MLGQPIKAACSPVKRMFEPAVRTGQVRKDWGLIAVELNLMHMDEPATSELHVGSHVLLGAIAGGSPSVEVDADGAAPWKGSRQRGAAGFYPSGRRMRSRWPAGTLTYLALFIEPEASNTLLGRNVGNLDWQTRTGAEDPFITATLERLAAALLCEDDPLATLTAETLATGLHLHLLSRFSDLRAGSTTGQESLGLVLDLIHAELPRSIPLAQMVVASGLPRGRFLAAFRESTGLSPHQYILRERLARARAILETTKRSVGEVAIEVGFANAGALSDLFRQRLGVSPQAWRRGRDRFQR